MGKLKNKQLVFTTRVLTSYTLSSLPPPRVHLTLYPPHSQQVTIMDLEKGKIVEAELQARYDRLNVTYKTVNNTPIDTAIFIPKTFASGTEPATAPVLVHFHGGGLFTGANPDVLFLVDWFVRPYSPVPLNPIPRRPAT